MILEDWELAEAAVDQVFHIRSPVFGDRINHPDAPFVAVCGRKTIRLEHHWDGRLCGPCEASVNKLREKLP